MSRGLPIGVALALCSVFGFAKARPPTVLNSPGYDARLQESRKALSGAPTAPEPTAPAPAMPKRNKKKHPN